MMRGLLVLGAGLVAGLYTLGVQAAPPFEIKGLTLGMSASAFQEKYPYAFCAENKGEDRVTGDRACKLARARPVGPNIPLELQTLAGREAGTYLFFFIGDAVETIIVGLPANAFPDVLAGLVAKYGKPGQVGGSNVWRRESQQLEVRRQGIDPGEMAIMIRSDRSFAEERLRGDAARRAARKDL